MSEWITRCDGCGGPVRVAVPQHERAAMQLYCERCFEQMPADEAPLEERRPAPAPGAPPAAMKGPPIGFTGFLDDEAVPSPAPTATVEVKGDEVSDEEDSFTCPTCEGRGRVKKGVG